MAISSVVLGEHYLQRYKEFRFGFFLLKIFKDILQVCNMVQ